MAQTRTIRTSAQLIEAARMLASRGEGWEDLRTKLNISARDAMYYVREAEARRQRARQEATYDNQ